MVGSSRSLYLAKNSSIKINTAFTLFNKTSLSGNGTVTTNLFTNEGVISAGSSPGSISIIGDYVQTDSGVLRMEIQDESTTGYDHLNVSGDAKIAGTIQFVALNGYEPSPNFRPNFISAKSSKITAKIDNSESPHLHYKFNADGSVSYKPLVLVTEQQAGEPINSVISMLAIPNQGASLDESSPLGNSTSFVSRSSESFAQHSPDNDKKKDNNTGITIQSSTEISKSKMLKPLGVCK